MIEFKTWEVFREPSGKQAGWTVCRYGQDNYKILTSGGESDDNDKGNC